MIGGPDSAAAKALPGRRRLRGPDRVAGRDRPRAEPVHTVEAFGPLTTVIGYDTADDVVALAALGQGSLVGSVYSYDPTSSARSCSARPRTTGG